MNSVTVLSLSIDALTACMNDEKVFYTNYFYYSLGYVNWPTRIECHIAIVAKNWSFLTDFK